MSHLRWVDVDLDHLFCFLIDLPSMPINDLLRLVVDGKPLLLSVLGLKTGTDKTYPTVVFFEHNVTGHMYLHK